MHSDTPPSPVSGPSRVFISYAWASPEHQAEVRALADCLRVRGVDVRLDQYEESEPPAVWAQWAVAQVDEADFVLVVASDAYAERAAGKAPEGIGLGAAWEYAHIVHSMSVAGMRPHKFIPVAVRHEDVQHLPSPLARTSRYVVGAAADRRAPGPALAEQLERLYARLTGQQTSAPPLVGSVLEPQALFGGGPADTSSVLEPPPDATYLRGVRLLGSGKPAAAAPDLRAAARSPDPALSDAAAEALIGALLQSGDLPAAEEAALPYPALLRMVRQAQDARGRGIAASLDARLRGGDPALAGLRQALHDAVVDGLAGRPVENQHVLASAGAPDGSSGYVSGVSADYVPRRLSVEWSPGPVVVAELDVELMLDIDVPRHALGELAPEQWDRVSGTPDDDVWGLSGEVAVVVVARVPMIAIPDDELGHPEVELPDLDYEHHW